jgi:hypothetical protein
MISRRVVLVHHSFRILVELALQVWILRRLREEREGLVSHCGVRRACRFCDLLIKSPILD